LPGSTMLETGRIHELFLAGLLDSLHAEVVVIDKRGVIQAVNATWNQFAVENGLDPDRVAPGTNYLEVCRQAFKRGDKIAGEAVEAIEAVLNRSSPRKVLEYSCNSSDTARWFHMRVKPFQAIEGGVVIEHENVTELKQMQAALSSALTEVKSLKAQ